MGHGLCTSPSLTLQPFWVMVSAYGEGWTYIEPITIQVLDVLSYDISLL